MSDKECPYGADDCPKVRDMKDLLINNSKEIYQLKQDIIALNTTIRNAGILISVAVAVVCAVIGIINIG